MISMREMDSVAKFLHPEAILSHRFLTTFLLSKVLLTMTPDRVGKGTRCMLAYKSCPSTLGCLSMAANMDEGMQDVRSVTSTTYY